MTGQEKSVSDAVRRPCSRTLVQEFSALGELQQAHTLQYRLKRLPQGWMLTLTHTAREHVRQESVRVDVCSTLARELHRYLYENAVSLEIWRDVLADLVPPEKIRPVDEHEKVQSRH